MWYEYRTQGTCSRSIHINLNDDGVIEEVKFDGGCSGNTQGLAKMVQGLKAEDVIRKLKGIRCGFRATSCPDQLATALSEILNGQI